MTGCATEMSTAFYYFLLVVFCGPWMDECVFFFSGTFVSNPFLYDTIC